MHLGPPGKGPMDRLYHFVWAHGFDQMHSYSDYKSDVSVFLKTFQIRLKNMCVFQSNF